MLVLVRLFSLHENSVSIQLVPICLVCVYFIFVLFIILLLSFPDYVFVILSILFVCSSYYASVNAIIFINNLLYDADTSCACVKNKERSK